MSVRRQATALVAAVMVAAPTAAAGEPPGRGEPARPNILLVTIDTLRADAVGFVGGTDLTPVLDSLAAAGRSFATAVTPVPLTLPAHVSLMTGLRPPRHGVRDNGQTVSADLVTLAEILGDAGWSTAAFVGGFPVDAAFGLDQGFDEYDDRFTAGREGWLERPADGTTEAALEWVRSAPEPWFAWVHYYDPHDPYEPPRAFWRPGERGAYLGEVAFVDYALGRLVRDLPSTDRGRLTVVTADHGEALGDHAEERHGFFVYDVTMAVPLVVHWPGRVPSAPGDGSPRLVDLAPTLLELVGEVVPAAVDGSSFARQLLEGAPIPALPAYIETRLPWIYYGWSPLEGIRTDRWKLIRAPRPELYDLAKDPLELTNLYDPGHSAVLALDPVLDELRGGGGATSTGVVDPETVAALRALGYVGAGSSTEPPATGLADPKDRIALRDRLRVAEEAIDAGRFAAAVQVFDEVLEVEPENRSAMLRSGVALLRSGRPRDALPRLERSVGIDPNRAEARFALGDAQMRLGRYAAAADTWKAVTDLQPNRFEAWFNLGAALGESGRHFRARAAYLRARELRPGDPKPALAAAREARRDGAAEVAVTELRRIAASWKETEPFAGATQLGLALLETGAVSEARTWLERGLEAGFEPVEASIGLARVDVRRELPREATDRLRAVLERDPTLRHELERDPELGPHVPVETAVRGS